MAAPSEIFLADVITNCLDDVIPVVVWKKPMQFVEIALRLRTEITQYSVELRKVTLCDCVIETSWCCLKCPLDPSKEEEINTIRTAARRSFTREMRGWPEFRGYNSRVCRILRPELLVNVVDQMLNFDDITKK
jgi:hypothetical protein